MSRDDGAGAGSILLAFILGAGFNGASFLNYNEDANSYVMALLFASFRVPASRDG